METGALIGFFLFTYAATGACFLAAIYLPGGLRTPLLLLGTFTPSLAALWLTAHHSGAGIRALLRPMFDAQVAGRWYLFAIGYMASMKLAAAGVQRLTAGAWPCFGDRSWYVIEAAIVISAPVQAGEEIGWRGYALPRLARRFGLVPASLVLGLIWACWHLPFFFVPESDNYGRSFPMFVAGVTALSVAIAWLYANTGGSLLLTMLMHSAVNQTAGIVAPDVAYAGNPFALSASRVAWLTDAMLWIAAGYFIIRMRRIASGRMDSKGGRQ